LNQVWFSCVTNFSSGDIPKPVNADSSVRKSKRTNAGKHSNPFNLTKYVAVSKADVRGNLDQVKFEQLGEAIAALSEYVLPVITTYIMK
jgi:hypothetical protein